jgi:hypothetical protein
VTTNLWAPSLKSTTVILMSTSEPKAILILHICSVSKSDKLTEEAGMIGREARDLYEDGNPKSVDFTVSSLLFERSMSEGCEVEGLYEDRNNHLIPIIV